MHLIVSLLCLKSFDGSHCFRGLNKKQTLGMNYNVLQRMSILVIPTALTSFHTTPHSKRQPHLSLVAEIVMYQGLYTYCLLYS